LRWQKITGVLCLGTVHGVLSLSLSLSLSVCVCVCVCVCVSAGITLEYNNTMLSQSPHVDTCSSDDIASREALSFVQDQEG